MRDLKSYIDKPTLVVDPVKARANIRRMAARARESGVRFRPHFKTHQSAEVGEWFRSEGVEAITVSSVDMALFFAAHGWRDISIAFPVNVRQIDTINDLAGRIRLQLLVESEEVVRLLKEKLTAPADAWIKIDTGYGRTGIPAARTREVLSLAAAVAGSRRLSLQGLLTHSGHTYHAASRAEIRAIYDDTVVKLSGLRRALVQGGCPAALELSVGDTPCCSVVEDLSAVDEIRPGNFVYYDLTQLALGACTQQELAAAVACPVVAAHEERGTLVIYGGAVHFSKESLRLPDGREIFGQVAGGAGPAGKPWGPLTPEAYLVSVSQEHGIVQAPAALLRSTRIGDLLTIIPVHSCLAADLLRPLRTSP
jgi:D-serine deaminase-like pyridoxal phosphate-dependent protein